MLKLIKSLKVSEHMHYIYKCDKCNALLYSRDKKINQCKVCNNANYDVKDIHADERYFNELLSGSKQKSEFRPDSSKSNDIWEELGSIWTDQQVPWGMERRFSKYVLKCRRCGTIKLTTEHNISEIVCNNCRYYLSLVVSKNTKAEWERLERNYNEENRRKQVKAEIHKQAEEAEKSEKIDKKDSTTYRLKERIPELNPNLKMVSRYSINGSPLGQLQCSKCGYLFEKYLPGLRGVKSIECRGCKIAKDDPNYLGITKRDLKDTVKNGLKVIKTYDDKVKVGCHICGKELNKLYDKISFLNGKIVHEGCKESKSLVSCPVCGALNEKSYESVINSVSNDTKLYCISCKEEIPNYLFKNDIASLDVRIETRLALDEHSKKIGDTVDLIGDISKSKDILYINSKGEEYYNCRCTQHHQSLILSQSDLENYDHKKCNIKYNLFVNQKELNNLAFIRKKEVHNE